MASGEPMRQIEQLRRHRARPGRDPSIAAMVASTRDHVSRTHRRLGQLIDLWEQLVPTDIASRTSVTGLRGGTAHVAVDSSATSFELDRLLREGLLDALREQFRGTLVRIRVRVAPDALDGG